MNAQLHTTTTAPTAQLAPTHRLIATPPGKRWVPLMFDYTSVPAVLRAAAVFSHYGYATTIVRIGGAL